MKYCGTLFNSNKVLGYVVPRLHQDVGPYSRCQPKPTGSSSRMWELHKTGHLQSGIEGELLHTFCVSVF